MRHVHKKLDRCSIGVNMAIMPRLARPEAPGAVHRIVIREIESPKIFINDKGNTLVLRNKAVRAMGVSFQKPHMPASLYGTAV
jgi:hypothetical protein